MSAAGRGIGLLRRLRTRVPGWVWFIGLAFAWGVVIVVVAFAVNDRCSDRDPICAFHSYSLVGRVGPGVLGFVGAPRRYQPGAAGPLHVKVTRRSHRADRAALSFAVLS